MKHKRQFLLVLLVVLSLLFIPSQRAVAQEEPFRIYFDPEPAFLYIGGDNTLVVNVNLANAANAWAYTIIVNYDPNIVSLESYEIVDIFGGEMCVYQVNTPGYFGLGCNGWTGGVPFFGDSTVVKLTFKAVALGETALTFDSRTGFANKPGQKLPIIHDHGSLHVVNPANFIYLPLLMNVSVQGALNRGGIEVALGRGTNFGMGPYFGTSINDSDENLEITGVVADSYRISTNQPRVLNISPEMNKIFTLASGATHVPALLLVPGNAVWTDNEINDDDVDAVLAAWGDVTLNPDADVNFDGAVDARDLALVAGNFGLNSGTAYAAWLP